MLTNSAFVGTALEALLRDGEAWTLYRAGLSIDRCASTAANLPIADHMDAAGRTTPGDTGLATAACRDGHKAYVESLGEFMGIAAAMTTTEEVFE
jgi:nicotinamidase-related amidase